MGTEEYSTNLIYGTGSGHSQSQQYVATPDIGDWVEHQLDWTPDYIKWYVNGEVTRTETSDSYSVSSMSKETAIRMNFWAPDWSPWGDSRDDSSMPWHVDYDYVEISTYNQDTKDFDFHWRDKFDNLDTSRW